MVKVPTPDTQGPQRLGTVQTQPANTPYQRFDVPVMDDVGKYLSRIGQAGMQLASTLKAKQQERQVLGWQEEANQIRLDMNDPERGYRSRQGAAAEGVTSEYLQRIQQRRDAALQGLSGLDAATARNFYDGLAVDVTSTLARHEAAQLSQHAETVYSGVIDVEFEAIRANAGDDEFVNQAMARIENAADTILERRGLVGEEAAAARQAFNQDLLTSAVLARTTALAADDPERALEVLQSNEDQIDANQFREAYDLLDTAVVETRAERAFREAYGGQSVATAPGQAHSPAPNVAITQQTPRVVMPVPELTNGVSRAVEAFFGPGARMDVTSGRRRPGNDPSGRHRTGLAVDFQIYRPDGTRVDPRTDADGREFAVFAFGIGATNHVGFGYSGMGTSFDFSLLDEADGGDAMTDGMADALRDQMLAARNGDFASAGPTRAAAAAQAYAGLTPANAVDRFVDAIIGAESGGRATAQNPNSSAGGLGQFIDSTWLEFMQARYPDRAASLSRNEQLQLKMDPELSREATTWYAEGNARALQNGGFSPTAGNLYLAHFAGPGGALAVLRASDTAPVRELLGSTVVSANANIRFNGKRFADFTASDLRAWAASKMDEHGAASGAPAGEGAAFGAQQQVVPAPSVFQQLMGIEDERVRAAALERYDQTHTLYAEEQQRQRDTLTDQLISQIQQDELDGNRRPLNEYLDPETVRALGEDVKGIRDFYNSGGNQTDYAFYTAMREMAATNPSAFLQAPTGALRARLSSAHYERLLDLRTALQGEMRDVQPVNVSDFRDLLGNYLTGAEIDANSAEGARIANRLEGLVLERAQSLQMAGERELNDTHYRGILDELMRVEAGVVRYGPRRNLAEAPLVQVLQQIEERFDTAEQLIESELTIGGQVISSDAMEAIARDHMLEHGYAIGPSELALRAYRSLRAGGYIRMFPVDADTPDPAEDPQAPLADIPVSP